MKATRLRGIYKSHEISANRKQWKPKCNMGSTFFSVLIHRCTIQKETPSPAVPSHSLILFRPEREHAFGALRKQLVGYRLSPTVKHPTPTGFPGLSPSTGANALPSPRFRYSRVSLSISFASVVISSAVRGVVPAHDTDVGVIERVRALRNMRISVRDDSSVREHEHRSVTEGLTISAPFSGTKIFPSFDKA